MKLTIKSVAEVSYVSFYKSLIVIFAHTRECRSMEGFSSTSHGKALCLNSFLILAWCKKCQFQLIFYQVFPNPTPKLFANCVRMLRRQVHFKILMVICTMFVHRIYFLQMLFWFCSKKCE